MKNNSRFHFSAAVATVFCLSFATPAAHAQVAIDIPAASLDAALSQCASASSSSDGTCAAALQILIEQLIAANPEANAELVVGSVISAIASGYNDAAIDPAVAQAALASLASVASSRGLTTLATVATNAASTVVAGDPIDLEAVAEASGSPT